MKEDGQSDPQMNQDAHAMSGGGFMSMVMMTKDLPSSSDGLKMEDTEVQFGPNHPALPPSLAVHFTLDGDTVRQARFTVSKNGKKEPAATTLETHLAWLQRVAVAVDYPLLQRAIQQASAALRSANEEQTSHATKKMTRLVTKNPFLRVRLQNLAMHKNMDAYQRLIKVIEGIEEAAGMPAGKTLNQPDSEFTSLESVAAKLEGLELAQAFAAIASFHIDTSKLAKR